MSQPPPAPVPGWYPATHANNEIRFWDGATWHDTPPPPAGPAMAPQAAPAATRKRSSNWQVNLGIIIVGVFLIFLALGNSGMSWMGLIGFAAVIAGILLWIQDGISLRRKKGLAAEASASEGPGRANSK